MQAAATAALLAGRARARTWSVLRRLEEVPTWRVLATFVALQWVLVLGLAATVRHNGWIYYQGGDQLWYYTTSWLLGHGHFGQPGVGYLWCELLAPIAMVIGPNIANAYPAIVVLQFLFLLPVAMLAIYGIGSRIGGRLFGYWTAALWLLVPLIGIKYTDAGYHQRFTEVLLPQGFGLTAMGDFPSMVATLVAGYFCVRALTGSPTERSDALFAGLAAGAAFAVKPGTAFVVAGPILAFAVSRKPRAFAAFAAGVAPAVIALAYVKWRGYGYLPILHAAGSTRVAAGAGPPLGGLGSLHDYVPFHWDVFTQQLDQVREHFWSVRLVEWLVVAGMLGLFLRSRLIGALIFGWFFPIVVLKTASGRGDMEGGNLLRLLMPAYPAFVLLIASLPFLIPTVARRMPWQAPSAPLLTRQWRLTAVAAAILLTAVVPMAAYAVASPEQGQSSRIGILQQPPIPLHQNLGVRARHTAGGVTVNWEAQHSAGGAVFYHVFRRRAGTSLLDCGFRTGDSADQCTLQLDDLGATRSPRFVDHTPVAGASYYVGVAANWLNDLGQGDVYVLSEATVPAR